MTCGALLPTRQAVLRDGLSSARSFSARSGDRSARRMPNLPPCSRRTTSACDPPDQRSGDSVELAAMRAPLAVAKRRERGSAFDEHEPRERAEREHVAPCVGVLGGCRGFRGRVDRHVRQRGEVNPASRVGVPRELNVEEACFDGSLVIAAAHEHRGRASCPFAPRMNTLLMGMSLRGRARRAVSRVRAQRPTSAANCAGYRSP